MPEIDHQAESTIVSPASSSVRVARSHRARWVAAVLLLLVLLALVPPYVNVSRFQHRIAGSLSESLGRPVHFDRIELTLLPMPGFRIENLVVADDPTYSHEPVIRAMEVRGTLRFSSLWHRRVEFSSISFTDPSINLVRRPDGRWNVESILLRAAQIAAEPAKRPTADSAIFPRFPYIEATGARLNLKMDLEKMPVALTDTKLAFWLPDAEAWHLRLEGHPARTDTNITDTGTLRIEGKLGRAPSLEAVPVDLRAEWRDAPLGAVSQVITGGDFGWRGKMLFVATAKGAMGEAALTAGLKLEDVRRAEFVPANLLVLDVSCTSTAGHMFQSFTNVACKLPIANSPAPGAITVAADIPEVQRLASARIDIDAARVPAATLLDWMHIASSRMTPDIAAKGELNGTAHLLPGGPWQIKASIAKAVVTLGSGSKPAPILDQDVVLDGEMDTATSPASVVTLHPLKLEMGAKEPATLDGTVGLTGYTLHLVGPASAARVEEIATAVPPFGDGLPSMPKPTAPGQTLNLDLASTRQWHGSQEWQQTVHAAKPRAHHKR